MNYLIPNFVVQSSKENDTLINDMIKEGVIRDTDSDKVLLIFKYMSENTTRANTVNFTLSDLISGCGFVAKRGTTNDKFKAILHYLNVNSYFAPSEIDFLNIKPNEFLYVPVQYFSTKENGDKQSYFMLEDEEVDGINAIKNVDNGKLLLYFCTVKSRIYNGNDRPKVCYPTVGTMCKDISISSTTIENYNDILEENGVLYIGNAGKFAKEIGDKVVYRQSANTYTIPSIDDYVEEVERSVKGFTSEMIGLDWATCKEPDIDTRKINGTLNKLGSMERTVEQEKAYQVAIEAKKIKDAKEIVMDEDGYPVEEVEEIKPIAKKRTVGFGKVVDEIAERKATQVRVTQFDNVEPNTDKPSTVDNVEIGIAKFYENDDTFTIAELREIAKTDISKITMSEIKDGTRDMVKTLTIIVNDMKKETVVDKVEDFGNVFVQSEVELRRTRAKKDEVASADDIFGSDNGFTGDWEALIG